MRGEGAGRGRDRFGTVAVDEGVVADKAVEGVVVALLLLLMVAVLGCCLRLLRSRLLCSLYLCSRLSCSATALRSRSRCPNGCYNDSG